jgi:hypothetical protein
VQIALEKELKERLDVHEAAIVSILQRVMDIIDPPAPPKKETCPALRGRFQACPSKPEGRSRVKESKARYVVRRKTG